MIKKQHVPFSMLTKQFFTLRLLFLFEVLIITLTILFTVFFYFYFYLPIIAQQQYTQLFTPAITSSSNVVLSEYEAVVKFHQEKIDTGKKIHTNTFTNPFAN